MLTIDDMIRRLEKARKASPLGGDTVVCLCEHEVPYKPITQVKLDTGGDGAVLLLKTPAQMSYHLRERAGLAPTSPKRVTG